MNDGEFTNRDIALSFGFAVVATVAFVQLHFMWVA